MTQRRPETWGLAGVGVLRKPYLKGALSSVPSPRLAFGMAAVVVFGNRSEGCTLLLQNVQSFS